MSIHGKQDWFIKVAEYEKYFGVNSKVIFSRCQSGGSLLNPEWVLTVAHSTVGDIPCRLQTSSEVFF